MKKFGIILVILAMAVLDLIFAGVDIVLGLGILAAAFGFAYLMDKANSAPRKTTSLTKAARMSREQRDQNKALSTAAAAA